jgi:hypothetical protein
MFFGSRPSMAATSGRVGDSDALKQRICQDDRNLAHEETVGRGRENPRCPGLAAAASCVLQCGAGTDQIVENDHGAIVHLTDQQLAGDQCAAAALLDECRDRLFIHFCRKRMAELLCPLGAADIRRNNRNPFVRSSRAK